MVLPTAWRRAWAACRPRALPLVEAVGEHEAAPASEGVAERGLVGDRLGPGVDHAAADGGVLGPEGNETPAHEPGASRHAADHGEDVLRGSDVVGGFERQLTGVKLEALAKHWQV